MVKIWWAISPFLSDRVTYSVALQGWGLQRISELHRSYDPLQYPLIFSYGTVYQSETS